MNPAQNKEIVRSFYEAGNRGDFDACFAMIADDIVWTNIGTTSLSGTYRGKADLMENLLGPLFGQLEAGIRSEIIRLIAEGDYVVALTSGTASTKDGREYNNSYCHVIRLRDGQFVEVTEYFDTNLTGTVFGFA
ncbi:MAG: nuclear transport factor 2 family protein [marine benthic group bacterium]|nr:nuclear transport factor 2 family protein [Gemmatimonadota bacterium]